MGQAPEMAAPLLLRVEDADAEWNSRPHRIALFVEPSPFASVSLLLLLLPTQVLTHKALPDYSSMLDWIRSDRDALRAAVHNWVAGCMIC